MKKYKVEIFNRYNNVIKEYHHNKLENAIKCAKRFNRWWTRVIDNEDFSIKYFIDSNGIEIDYRKTKIEPF